MLIKAVYYEIIKYDVNAYFDNSVGISLSVHILERIEHFVCNLCPEFSIEATTVFEEKLLQIAPKSRHHQVAGALQESSVGFSHNIGLNSFFRAEDFADKKSRKIF